MTTEKYLEKIQKQMQNPSDAVLQLSPALAQELQEAQRLLSLMSPQELQLLSEHMAIVQENSDVPTKTEPLLFRDASVESAETLSAIRKELEEREKKLSEYVAAEKAKQKDDDAQRVLDAKKQRRHDWLIALASAGITQILNLVCTHFEEILVFFRELFS